MNMAPGGTALLVDLRRELLDHLKSKPALVAVDQDLTHLLGSWFNRGFLELRRIDWGTPAAILEKLIAYEAVHEIQGFPDLKRRLERDRRCFAFFHPALPDEPLIFVEVAFVNELPSEVAPHPRDGERGGRSARARAARCSTRSRAASRASTAFRSATSSSSRWPPTCTRSCPT